MLSDFQDQIVAMLNANLFDDPDLKRTITWTLKASPGTAEQAFTANAVLIGHEVESENLEEGRGLGQQSAKRTYLLYESELPTGITIQALTKNDRITDSGAEFIVTFIDKTLEFIFIVDCLGAK